MAESDRDESDQDENDQTLAARLRASWASNADLWTQVVRSGGIPSRAAGTDRAILDAIARQAPRSMIDIGCGEGWLVRQVRKESGCDAIGIDASDALIACAKAADPDGRYLSLAYDQLDTLPAGNAGPFDAAICNFSLLDDALSTTLRAIRGVLADNGRLLIQTLHPWASSSGQPYRNGWREEDFAGFTKRRWHPMPWYFRTLGSWLREIERAGMTLVAIDEPLDDKTQQPLSLLLTCVGVRGTNRHAACGP